MDNTIKMLQLEVERLQKLLDQPTAFYETLAPSASKMVDCTNCGVSVLPEDVIFTASGNKAFCSTECLELTRVIAKHSPIPQNHVTHSMGHFL